MAAKLRYARKNEVYQSDIDEILSVFDAENTKIEWLSMSREQQRYGNHSRWAIYARLDENDTWTEEGQLYICTECGEIFPIMPGNVYDDMVYCENCGTEIEDYA